MNNLEFSMHRNLTGCITAACSRLWIEGPFRIYFIVMAIVSLISFGLQKFIFLGNMSTLAKISTILFYLSLLMFLLPWILLFLKTCLFFLVFDRRTKYTYWINESGFGVKTIIGDEFQYITETFATWAQFNECYETKCHIFLSMKELGMYTLSKKNLLAEDIAEIKRFLKAAPISRIRLRP